MVLGKAHVSIIMRVSWTQPLHWCWPCYRTATQLRWLVWGQITLEEQRQVALKEHLDLCQYLDTMEKTRVCFCLKGKKKTKTPQETTKPNPNQIKPNPCHNKARDTVFSQKLPPLPPEGPACHYTSTTLWTCATTAKLLCFWNICYAQE